MKIEYIVVCFLYSVNKIVIVIAMQRIEFA